MAAYKRLVWLGLFLMTAVDAQGKAMLDNQGLIIQSTAIDSAKRTLAEDKLQFYFQFRCYAARSASNTVVRQQHWFLLFEHYTPGDQWLGFLMAHSKEEILKHFKGDEYLVQVQQLTPQQVIKLQVKKRCDEYFENLGMSKYFKITEYRADKVPKEYRHGKSVCFNDLDYKGYCKSRDPKPAGSGTWSVKSDITQYSQEENQIVAIIKVPNETEWADTITFKSIWQMHANQDRVIIFKSNPQQQWKMVDANQSVIEGFLKELQAANPFKREEDYMIQQLSHYKDNRGEPWVIWIDSGTLQLKQDLPSKSAQQQTNAEATVNLTRGHRAVKRPINVGAATKLNTGNDKGNLTPKELEEHYSALPFWGVLVLGLCLLGLFIFWALCLYSKRVIEEATSPLTIEVEDA